MKQLKRALALILALLPAAVAAQQFPTVPDHTVVGRIGTGSGSGPSQAIPFTTLAGSIGLPSSYAVGDLIYATSSTALGRLADVAAGQPLISGGLTTAPLYSGSWVFFDPTNKLFGLNRNTAADSVVGTGTVFLIDQADATNSLIETRAYGGSTNFTGFLGSKAGGTLASRTSVQSGDKLAQFAAAGWNGGTNTYDVVGALTFSAAENFSTGHDGSNSKLALITSGTFNEKIVQQWFGTGKAAIGSGDLTNPQGTLTVSSNVTAGVTSVSSTPVLQVVGVDSTAASIDVASFASPAGINLNRANNTAASKTAVASGDNIGVIFASGWDTANYISSAGFRFNANQTFSVGNNGTSIIALTTANGSATVSEAGRWWGSKSLSVGPSGTADPGASGIVNVATGIRVANAATSGNVLRGDGTNFISAQLGIADTSGYPASGTTTTTAGCTGGGTVSGGSTINWIFKTYGKMVWAQASVTPTHTCVTSVSMPLPTGTARMAQVLSGVIGVAGASLRGSIAASGTTAECSTAAGTPCTSGSALTLNGWYEIN